MNPKRSTPRHIIKVSKVKDKEKILKAAQKKQNKKKLVRYKGTPIRVSADFFQQKLCRTEGYGMIYSKC